VEVTYGRIGAQGRRVRHVARDEADARRIVRHCLQRCSAARKRIGVGYQLRELADSGQWLEYAGKPSSASALPEKTLLSFPPSSISSPV
jgi:hypothetical protein